MLIQRQGEVTVGYSNSMIFCIKQLNGRFQQAKCNMNKEPIAVIYSGSLNERDFLRNQVGACGLSAICFEQENTCIDNIKSIQPGIVIVQTDFPECVWRFLFSLHFTGLRAPLLILSERLNAERFEQFGLEMTIHSITNHHQGRQLLNKIKTLTATPLIQRDGDGAPLLVGESPDIEKIRTMMPSLSRSRDCILIMGERGTGKELISRLIVQSANARNDIIKINCSGLEPQVLINGAMKKIIGLIKKSNSVTVLLDKIHLISSEIQADLLLLVEEAQKFRDLEKANSSPGVRFIATSENKIEELVNREAFRKDLYYRLNVIPVFLRPLRDRKMDVSLLMDYFIIESSLKNNKCIVIPSKKTRETLYAYHWPGNVDELRNYMYRVSAEGHESCIFNNNSIQKILKSSGQENPLKATGIDPLPEAHEIKAFIPTAENLSLRSICDEFVARTEKRLMKKALESTNWNRKKAAALLNISYKSMLNKIKAYDII